MKTDRPESSPLDGLRPPAPPAGLRGRVMEAAGEAMRGDPKPDAWTRLWQSGPARLAWVACVLVLVVGHAALTRPTETVGRKRSMQLRRFAGTAERELAEIAELPRLAAGTDLGGAIVGRLADAMAVDRESNVNGTGNDVDRKPPDEEEKEL